MRSTADLTKRVLRQSGSSALPSFATRNQQAARGREAANERPKCHRNGIKGDINACHPVS